MDSELLSYSEMQRLVTAIKIFADHWFCLYPLHLLLFVTSNIVSVRISNV